MSEQANIELTEAIDGAFAEARRREHRQVVHWLIVAVALAVGVGIGVLLMLPGWMGY